MNKYQGALDRLLMWATNGYCALEVPSEEYEDLKEIMQELVDKATPKKPIGRYTDYKCPVCGRRVRSGKGSSSFVRDNVCQRCFQVLDWSEEEEYREPILDEKEREYLSAVIKPWRDKVISIAKNEYDIFEFIQIKVDGEEYGLDLPNFEEGTMYKGMELNREYSLEDLGL